MVTKQETQEKILNSGVCRLDEKNQPIGIFELKHQDYSLRKKNTLKPSAFKRVTGKEPIPNAERSQVLTPLLVRDLTRVLHPYVSGGMQMWCDNYKREFEDGLEKKFNGLKDFLIIDYQIDKDYVHKSLVKLAEGLKKKVDKTIKKALKQQSNKTIPPEERRKLVHALKGAFGKYTNIKPTPTLHYIAHLLCALNLQPGTHRQVFKTIQRERQRHSPKQPTK